MLGGLLASQALGESMKQGTRVTQQRQREEGKRGGQQRRQTMDATPVVIIDDAHDVISFFFGRQTVGRSVRPGDCSSLESKQ